jgi:hypothetical protein
LYVHVVISFVRIKKTSIFKDVLLKR